jgi:6-phosphogluconate dehydrogenase
MKGDIGVIDLAVMGQNLILNMNDHGFKVVAHNRTAAKVDEFLEGPAKGTNIVGAYSLEELYPSDLKILGSARINWLSEKTPI